MSSKADNNHGSQNDPMSPVWMVRTADNILSGPFSQKQIIQLIEERQLELTDELCNQSTYWFYLHEAKEVKRGLGIDLPSNFFEGEEHTETDSGARGRLHSSGDSHSHSHAAMSGRSARNATVSQQSESGTDQSTMASLAQSSQLDPEGVPELSVPHDSIGENPSVLSNRKFRDYNQKESAEDSTKVLNLKGSLVSADPESVESESSHFEATALATEEAPSRSSLGGEISASSVTSTGASNSTYQVDEKTPPSIVIPQRVQSEFKGDDEDREWSKRWIWWVAVVLFVVLGFALRYYFMNRK